LVPVTTIASVTAIMAVAIAVSIAWRVAPLLAPRGITVACC
jgi:hypothetical protein